MTPRQLFSLFVLGVGLCLPLPCPAAVGPGEPAKLLYSRAKYDPKADADADLKKAKSLAAGESRRILIIAGGDWCPWCRAIAKYIESNAAVSAVLAKHYVIQKVFVSAEVSNTSFLDPLGPIEAYPHLFVLDKDGKLQHSQDTGRLEKSGLSYDEAQFVALLTKWSKSK
jgi:hypothetical protein